jgi:pimeloyl-ACP methyl ester carboxylesterase
MSNFLQINGRRIHYVETGPRNAPAVVLLHGQSGFWYDWSDVAPGLAKNYRVVAIDHPGFGDSDWDPSYKTYLVEGFAKEMEEVTKQLSLDRFVLVGHSFGGRIGLAYACSHPKQLRAVVLADSSPDVDPAGSLEARKYLASIPAEFETFEQAMEFFHKHYPNFTSNSLRERLLNYLTQLPSGSYRVKRDPAIGAKYSLILQGKAQAPEPDWGSLRNVTCPVLLLRGTNSELVTIGIENQMRQVNPHMETVEITNAGHLVATEQPEQVLKALLNYLRHLPA